MRTCRVGFAQVELSSGRRGANTGWGPMGRLRCAPPTVAEQRLLVSALALEDERGERVVLVNADLHCGGSHLWRAAVEASGLDPSRVVVCGSHTHAGPGQRYGGFQYSLMAGPSPVDAWLSHRHVVPPVARAVRQALGSLTPGGVTVARAAAPDAASNRAVPAWDHYDDRTREDFLERGPGSAVPPDRPLPDRLRDPRVTVLAARAEDGSMRAALAWFAVHGTALGAKYPHFGADLFGYARAEVEGAGWSIGFGGGTSADVSPLPVDIDGTLREPTEERPTAQGLDLAETIGRRIGVATLDAIRAAEGGAQDGAEHGDAGAGPGAVTGGPGPLTIGVAHEIWRPRRSGLPRPMVGMAQWGGGVDGSNDLWPEVGAGVHSPRYRARARHAYSEASGQGPKVAIVQAVVPLPLRFGLLFAVVGPRRFPLHVVRVGDHAFATVPGEPTTMSGWRIEQALLEATGCSSASVIGFAGDYGGYWVTPEEYREQRYEAAATIYGRDAATRLTERLAELASSLR
jgi:neutral ceramidase